MGFNQPEIPEADARSSLAKDRVCLSCGEKIKKGHICDCQAPGAVNCPACKRNIKDPVRTGKLTQGTGPDNLEVQIHCRRTLSGGGVCRGYVYTHVFLEDFVAQDEQLRGE